VTNEGDEAEDAPPAVPAWEPGELAWRIARGHARWHFHDMQIEDLAREVQRVMDTGESKRYRQRELFWDTVSGIAVLVNPFDGDGGTAFPSDQRYFDQWGSRTHR
jgi:hypothetical protein